MIECPYLVRPGKKIELAKLKSDDRGPFKSKEDATAAAEKNLEQLDQLQEILYAESKQSLLIVLQAMDGGGKDGTIEFVFSGINPQGCRVQSFKAPHTTDLAHDYLWRIHSVVPPRGFIGIFNRSHYEDVLVPVVQKWITKPRAEKRYHHINEFERMLNDEGTTIVKFFLHISKEEQKERLIARQQDDQKWWKFSPGDIEVRKQWDAYQKAYETMLNHTSTAHAPWYIIPADRKWYRNFVVSDIVLKSLKKMRPQLPKITDDPRKYVIE
ncbi:MAG TPA: polyphosphate kinase 2 family protein [Tepidisphaeraceae bacterium]|nr:polyphosphate kinase 2 family protein [Tepidisphaeraceae bacterium]